MLDYLLQFPYLFPKYFFTVFLIVRTKLSINARRLVVYLHFLYPMDKLFASVSLLASITELNSNTPRSKKAPSV